MKAAIEISMYPLTPQYEAPILHFIEQLKSNDKLLVKTNAMSTQVFGDFDEVFSHVKGCIQQVFQGEHKTVFNMKVLANPLPADFTL